MPTCGRTAVKVFAKKGESVYLYLVQYYGNDIKAFDYIINHQKKRGWMPPTMGIYYVGSQQQYRNQYIVYGK